MGNLKLMQIVRRFSFQEWGGTETVVWNTSKKLIKQGCDNEIAATSALSETFSEVVNGISIKRFNYFYPHLGLSKTACDTLDKKGGNPYSLSLYRYLKESDADLFHCHTMQRLANTVRLAARKKGVPYVISFHGGHFEVPESEIEEMLAPLKGTFNYGKFFDIALGNRRFLHDADGIICVGYNEYLAAKDKYPDKLVEYLPNGVEPDKFLPHANNEFRKKYNIPDESELILCVSRIDYQKNQLMLVELINKLKDENDNNHLLLIGPVTSSTYFEKINSKINEYGLGKNVTIIQGLNPDDPDIVNAYNCADCFILPSVHEPFGIVVLEAWASKLPVIAAKTGGLHRLIDDGKTGFFFDNKSVDDLCEKYKLLKGNMKLKDDLRKNAYNEMLANYSWDYITEGLTSFYKEVIEKNKLEKI